MPRPSPASGPARQTMDKAFRDLEQTIAPQDSRQFHCTTLDDVRKAARDIERELAARRSLRNMRRLTPLFQGMEHYSKSMDVLCNGTPFLPWVWSPITLILRIASEYVEAFEQIIKGYSRIAESLKRFEILSQAFASEPGFQETMAAIYDDILQFHKHAYKFVRRSGWKILFLTSWGRFQRRFEGILEDIERHGALIDKEATARNIFEARQMRQDIRQWREENLGSLDQQEAQQSSKQFQSILSWLKIDESDQLALLDSVTTEEEKYPGVCSWLIECLVVKEWLQRNKDAPVLWVQGVAGSGKTFITAELVRFMKAAKMPVLYHFCSYSYESSITYEQILRTFILQILQRDGDLIAHVYSDYVLGKKSAILSTLENLLKSLLTVSSNEPSQVEYRWIILDGLDECQIEKQVRVVSFIKNIISRPSSSSSTVCKVLISSRASPAISNRLRNHRILSLTNEKVHMDKAIRLYASYRLRCLYQKFSRFELDREEMEDIEHKIVGKADGMFLYARLVLDYLATNIFITANEVKTSIDQLPETLVDFYQKILTQILVQLDPRSTDRVRCVLGWVAFQKRPLKKLEFLSAITFSYGDPYIANLAPDFVLDVCGGLLYQRQDTTVTFIHSSVKDFLQNASIGLTIDEQVALEEHGLAMITCLISGLNVFGTTYKEYDRQLRVAKGIHGLHVYATEHWADYLLSHVQFTSKSNNASALVALACDLAEQLEHRQESLADDEFETTTDLLDDRLHLLDHQPLLFKHVKIYLRTSSLKALEFKYLNPSGDLTTSLGIAPGDERCPTKANIPINGISAARKIYQETVRFLLEQQDFPGISAEDLRVFQSQFRGSAYTCRVRSCPRATVGYESKQAFLEHELSHTRRFPCTFSGCQYPQFTSAQALRKHVRELHNPPPAPRASQRPKWNVATRAMPDSYHSQSLNTPTPATQATIIDSEGPKTVNISKSYHFGRNSIPADGMAHLGTKNNFQASRTKLDNFVILPSLSDALERHEQEQSELKQQQKQEQLELQQQIELQEYQYQQQHQEWQKKQHPEQKPKNPSIEDILW